MFLKSFDEIAKLIPKDDKYHDVKILGNDIMIDGVRVHLPSQEAPVNKWDKRFLDLAKHISTWSKDPSTKCGAVIADSKNRIISHGYNGYPRQIDDSDMHNRDLKYEKVIHAEVNAILFANRNIEGCTLYVYPLPPCSRCMSIIIQSGITRIVTQDAALDKVERWGDSNGIGMNMLQEVDGMIIDFLKETK